MLRLGDMFGKFTCFTPNGSIIVDYASVGECLKKYIIFCLILYQPYQIVTRLEWEMSAKFIDCNSTIDEDHINNLICGQIILAFYFKMPYLTFQKIQTQISDFLHNMKSEHYSNMTQF